MSAAVADPVVEGPIRVDDVVLTRGDRTILDHVSALIPAGKATAVVGPSGAGKSTLLAVAAGFEPVDAGSVDNPFPRSATGVVLQAYGLIRLLTAAENVELALQSTGMPADEIRERAAHQLDRFGLAALADRRTDELSGGQQQRLAIARALVIEPRLVIADELTSELDPRNRDRILAEILGMREQGVTILLATHDGGVADRCDHVVRVGTAVDSAAEQRTRGAAAEAAIAEQRRRIDAQQQIVDREAARLADLQRALERLLDQRGR